MTQARTPPPLPGPSVVLRSAVVAPGGAGPALLVHGGAWAIPDAEAAGHHDGLAEALARGRALLLAGAAALDVVAETVTVLEAHGAFDAGCGAVLDRDGRVQLDAGLMDGATADWGAVANVRRLAHPILAARLLARGDGQARLLVGEGAEAFAAEHGHDLVENEALVAPRERARYEALVVERAYHTSRAFSGADEADPTPGFSATGPRGTVGCVALDRAGRLAAATSTGGAPLTPPGRVGDSPLVGAGYFASPHGAASATGWGEAIAAVLLCGRAVDAVEGGVRPEDAARGGLSRMAGVANPLGEPATGGLIVLDALGRGGWAYTAPRMARGGWRDGAEPWTAL